MTWYVLDIIMLFCIAGICTLAVFHSDFEDNLLQRIGLCIMALLAFARALELINDGYLFSISALDPRYLWRNIGVFFYAVGTVVKFCVRKWRVEHYLQAAFDRRKESKAIAKIQP